MELLEKFRTSQCLVEIYDTGWSVEKCKIFCIKSFHRKSGKMNIRFANALQLKGILKTYQRESKFKL